MSKQPTMAELRAQCAALGITPGRSLAETALRIEARKAADAAISAPTLPEAMERIASPAALRHYLARQPEAHKRAALLKASIDPVALEANWRKMQDAKRVMETPVNRRFPLMCGTALGTRDALQSYTPVYRGKPAMSVAEIAAELSGRLR